MNGNSGMIQFTDGSTESYDVVTVKGNGWVFARNETEQTSRHIPQERIRYIERDHSESTAVPSEVQA